MQATALWTDSIWNVKQLICRYDIPSSRVPCSVSTVKLSSVPAFMLPPASSKCILCAKTELDMIPALKILLFNRKIIFVHKHLKYKMKNNLFKWESLKTGDPETYLTVLRSFDYAEQEVHISGPWTTYLKIK